MKTSGIKIGILPILGEATCEARDPFPSSFPGVISFLLPRFFFLSLASFLLSPARGSGTSTVRGLHLHQLLVPAPSVSLLRSAAAATAARQKQLRRQATEAAAGGRRSCIFPAVFRPLQATIL